MNSPSTALLSAILRPLHRPIFQQTRAVHASKERKLSLLDKLHRKQRKAVRQELIDSSHRARTNPKLTAPPRPSAAPAPTAEPASPAPSSTPPITTSTGSSPPQLPYTIARAGPGQQLPVYHLAKGGGTKRLTRLRKLSGDLNALRDDLTRALGAEGGYRNGKGEKVDVVSVNWQTMQVLVRGWRGAEVRAWAEGRGF